MEVFMPAQMDWRPILDFWFHVDLSGADATAHWRMLEWWMRGGANSELDRFSSIVGAARAGELEQWRCEPLGRLSLILVLDQFPRGLYAGSPEAFSSDRDALQLAEEGFKNGHYDALASAWEQFFFFLPLAHAEGPGHLERMERILAASEQVLAKAPEHLKPIWQFSLSQAQANREVIARFGRFPHRNSVLGRASTQEEVAYIARGDFVHQRPLPANAHG